MLRASNSSQVIRLLIAACLAIFCASQSCNLGIDSAFLVRRYAFDSDTPFADTGSDSEDAVPTNLDASSIRPSSECPAGMGTCLHIDNPIPALGGALRYPQSAQYLTLPNLNSNQFANGITFAFWAKYDEMRQVGSVSQQYSQFMAFRNAYNRNYIDLRAREYTCGYNTCQPFGLNSADNAGYAPPFQTTAVPNPVPGEWFHFVWVRTFAGVQFYINAVQSWTISNIAQPANMLGPGFGDFYGVIGASLRFADYTDFNGYVDDFRMYSRGLDASEVASLFSCMDNDPNNNPNECNAGDVGMCSEWASCSKSDGTAKCTCQAGFEDVNGDGTVCEDINECQIEADASVCHKLATCDNTPGGFRCTCMQGIFGNGTHCQTESFAIRSVFNYPGSAQLDVDELKLRYATVLLPDRETTSADEIITSMDVAVVEEGGITQATFNLLFLTKTEAQDVLSGSARRSGSFDFSPMGGSMVDGPDIYRFVTGTTSDPYEVRATGLSVETVAFNPACMSSGCWVVEVIYTVGTDAFNVFYLPKAEGNDALSFDFDYTQMDATYPQSPASTFLPSTHPCSSMDYDASTQLPAAVTSCCIPAFLAMYRPVSTFPTALDQIQDLDLSVCTSGALPHQRDRSIDGSVVPMFATKSQQVDSASNVFPQPSAPGVMGGKGIFVDGVFSGMTESRVYSSGTVDPFAGIYKAVIEMDEVELRTMAGQLKGTVGVESTVDTFIGLVNFRPTGSKVLDAGAVQVAVHLEKTSFFSVSTHGTNDYTFLSYVNLRLVAVYEQDDDFSETTAEFADRTSRTNSTNAAHYVQVTFTLGSQYQPNADTGIIPLDSVRVGQGSFFSEGGVQQHACAQWDASFTDDTFDQRGLFVSRLGQTACAPGATMCFNPTSIPDQFVSFNVPLGIDWLPDPADDLSENVFVAMVISAIDTNSYTTAPNMGGEAKQMKTTLSASIPVVEGGVNIFCDGIVSKTDLEDVANADIILGTAQNAAELSRLTILRNISSTKLGQTESARIDTDSIESGLMTLVVKGDPNYFTQNAGTSGYSLELEDVITVHIMETGSTKFDFVKGKLDEAPADNDGEFDGYYLNGAFRFRINREEQRAHLEPTAELLAECPFNPPRPAAGSAPLATCVVRRDVRFRAFPHRVGGWSTAMEIARPNTDGEDEKRFMQTVLGKSDYAEQLGTAYAGVINTAYSLDGRSRRAWWINPGYEWTPTQTGGESIFTLSQKIFMFALINLNENYGDAYAFSCDAYPNAQQGEGKCFFSPGGSETWADANTACGNLAEGGTLASINSAGDFAALLLVRDTLAAWDIFLGLNDIANEGVWLNPDGTVPFTDWLPGEPNNSGEEDCSSIIPNGKMVDLRCSVSVPYICSVPSGQFSKPALHLPPLPSRRMLLSSETDEPGTGVGASVIETTVTPRKMMADAFGVAQDRVATFKVEMALSEAEACMQVESLQGQLRDKLAALLEEHASQFETVQVVSMHVNRGDVACALDGGARRHLSRVLLASPASVEAEMLIVFSPGTKAQIDLAVLQQQPSILAIETLVADKVDIVQPEVPAKDVVEDTKDDTSKEGSASDNNNTALIAGIAAGVGGASLLIGAAFLVMKKRTLQVEQQNVLSAVSVEDLKVQLGGDV